jgi:hypothetical protein
MIDKIMSRKYIIEELSQILGSIGRGRTEVVWVMGN